MPRTLNFLNRNLSDQLNQPQSHTDVHNVDYDKIYQDMSRVTYASDLESFKERVNEITSQGWEIVSSSFYGDFRYDGDDSHDFKAICFKKGSEVVIAYAGTKSFSDIKNDNVCIFNQQVPPKHEVSKQFIDHVLFKLYGDANPEETKGYNFTTTGHSLGAVLANLSILELHSKGVNAKTSIAFDNPGSYEILDALAQEKGIDLLEDLNHTQLISYNSEPNIINTTNTQFGTVKVFIPAELTQVKNLNSVAAWLMRSSANNENLEFFLRPKLNFVESWRGVFESAAPTYDNMARRELSENNYNIYEGLKVIGKYLSNLLESVESHKLYNFSEGVAVNALEWSSKIKIDYNENLFRQLKHEIDIENKDNKDNDSEEEDSNDHEEAGNFIMVNEEGEEINFNSSKLLRAISNNNAFDQVEMSNEFRQVVLSDMAETLEESGNQNDFDIEPEVSYNNENQLYASESSAEEYWGLDFTSQVEQTTLGDSSDDTSSDFS
jgi:hypothetical protein